LIILVIDIGMDIFCMLFFYLTLLYKIQNSPVTKLRITLSITTT